MSGTVDQKPVAADIVGPRGEAFFFFLNGYNVPVKLCSKYLHLCPQIIAVVSFHQEDFICSEYRLLKKLKTGQNGESK